MLLNLPAQICYQDNKRKKVTCTQVTYNPNLISVSNVSVKQTIDVNTTEKMVFFKYRGDVQNF